MCSRVSRLSRLLESDWVMGATASLLWTPLFSFCGLLLCQPFHHAVLELGDHGMKPLKLQAKITFFFFNLWVLGVLSRDKESDKDIFAHAVLPFRGSQFCHKAALGFLSESNSFLLQIPVDYRCIFCRNDQVCSYPMIYRLPHIFPLNTTVRRGY